MAERSFEQKLLRVLLCLAVFWGAWLLFQIEPLAGKIITPKFGGTSNVWTICLLFFQLVVLAGYLMTFAIARLPQRMQVIAYVVLFAVSLVWARVPGVDGWGFDPNADPTTILLAALTSRLAIPCIILSSISGTMQVWSGMAGWRNPYWLYSLSNLGSFGALLAYPVLIEPQLTVSSTLNFWQIVYYGLFALVIAGGVLVMRSGKNATANSAEDSAAAAAENAVGAEEVKPITGKQLGKWLFLSTMGSAGLLAFSSHITTDIAPVPLLWILPLAIYLVTFIIAFGKNNVNRDWLMAAWVPLVVAEPLLMFVSATTTAVINLFLLFSLCMVLHSELADSKPPVKQLPTFYLAIAGGGALGGIFVGLIAPLIFSFSGERLLVIMAFTIYQFFSDSAGLTAQRLMFRRVVAAAMAVTLVAWLIVPLPDVLHRERNFFGSVSVKKEKDPKDRYVKAMYHGRINHGQQFFDKAMETQNASLYAQPVALLVQYIRQMRKPDPMHLGVIGLGAGAVASEGLPDEKITFYELDPKIVRIANDWFSYLNTSKAKIDVQVGDGRLLLDKSSDRYDALSIDAFNGDAIPVHLLTVEAMKIYLNHIKDDGVIFFNTTNLFLDVPPIVGNLAKELGLSGCLLTYHDAVKYVVVSPKKETIEKLIAYAKENKEKYPETVVSDLPTRQDIRAWTDDYSNLFNILRVHN